MVNTNETAQKKMTRGQKKEITGMLVAIVDDLNLSSDEAQRLIGKKGNVATALRGLLATLAAEQTVTPPAKQINVKAALADWQSFYAKEFGLTIDLSTLEVPAQPNGFARLVVVVEGMTAQRLFDACQQRFRCWKYTDNLDEISNDPPLNQTYAVWFRDRVEADKELANKSANDLKAEKTVTITLVERLLLELKFFVETGNHLDVQNITLCAGSRDPNGSVPSVYWDDGRMNVYWYDPDYRYDFLRARAAVR